MGSEWNPGQYLRFGKERERPFWELIARIPGEPPARAIDLGCGPGTTTAALHAHWPQARIHGIDSSAAMIEQASSLAEPPLLTFELQDIRDWHAPSGSFDLVLSNAALHWVPGHVELFEPWLATLSEGGRLAFQVPRNFDRPSHLLLDQLAGEPRWAGRLAGVREALEVPSTEAYYGRLRALGFQVDMWETTYHQVLSGPDPVLEWVRGTALAPYLAALDADDAAAFEARYAAALRAAYPQMPSGETVFPFTRLFVVASRGG